MENWFNAFGWLVSIVTAAGNGFVIFLVAKNRQLHSRSANLFVFSLAVADFGIGIAVFPSSYFCKYSTACNFRVYMAFFWFFLHSSVTNLCFLTLDRYIAIVHPYTEYNNSTTKRHPGKVILIAWSIPFAISLSLLVGMYARTSNTTQIVLQLTGVSAFDIICCVLLFYAVVRILIVARARSHDVSVIELQVQINHSTEFSNSHRRGKNITARFIIALVVFFLGCYVAVNYLVFCLSFPCHIMPDQAAQVVTCLLVLNSAVNPFVYALLKKDIKEEIFKLFPRQDNHRVGSSATTTTALVSGAEYS